jgi:uncharacterized protein
MSLWVADTSPLIFLAKLNRLDLLREGAEEILVPQAVVEEVQQYQDEARQKIEDALDLWLKVTPVRDRRVAEVLLAHVDRGEAETIALALEVRAERVIMDDLDGRRLSRRVGLTAVGTLGLLLAARLRGDLSSLRAEIERLEKGGFRVGELLRKAVLEAAGE